MTDIDDFLKAGPFCLLMNTKSSKRFLNSLFSILVVTRAVLRLFAEFYVVLRDNVCQDIGTNYEGHKYPKYRVPGTQFNSVRLTGRFCLRRGVYRSNW